MTIRKLILLASCIGGSAIAAHAGPQDNPQNRRIVRESVAGLLSPLGVTVDMVEQIDLCHYRINRPNVPFQRLYDFTKAKDVFAFYGLTDSFPDGKGDIMISGTDSKFTCIVGGDGGDSPHDCDSKYVIKGATLNQFMKAHSAAEPMFTACSTDAQYKACTLYRGWKCDN
ncbi:hypothetical protein [Mesorhizobium sp. M2D.F.Ca.ET.233.01.1.1]|uniref:hypothetical protein n=2 Tax=unclassified Mesorhizobium TaxID=325217 RepID=UPI001093FA0E|nr:hypothetical protein [Mesorhizobium sp. M2D.F.Ca.ET.233.01.1.1]TGP14638.1 hypothetical protein EN876_25770 [Mesorhizobium sp. M2D.F.Ca.ET.233.01.1.1]TGV66835.1 hypothetical protein EN803_25255 [Mesorhizobium sp. M2D.F.Ca.ET.160.01.1.1]